MMPYGPILQVVNKVLHWFLIEKKLCPSSQMKVPWVNLKFKYIHLIFWTRGEIVGRVLHWFWTTLGRGYALHPVGVKFLTVNLTSKQIHLIEKTMSCGLTNWLQISSLMCIISSWWTWRETYGRWVHLPERAGGHALGPPTGHYLIL